MMITLTDRINLTPDELRASIYPGTDLLCATVKFTSQGGTKYVALHDNLLDTSQIFLGHKGSEDYEATEEIVARENNGTIIEEPRHIKLHEKITPAYLADLVERYRGHFTDVEVTRLRFNGSLLQQFKQSKPCSYVD